MASIELSDDFGLEIQVEPDPSSAFAKYFRQLPSLKILRRDLESLQNVALGEFPLKSGSLGLSFKQPVKIGTADAELTTGAAVSGSFSVFGGGSLFEGDDYGAPIDVPDKHAYLALGITTTLSSSLDGKTGDLSFGFAAGTGISFSNYKLFETTASGPTFISAMVATLREFAIPADISDLMAIATGTIVTIEGSGTIKFSGATNLLTSVNPLASISSGVLTRSLKVKAGGSIEVGASYKISGEYQIRIQKLDATKVQLGYYKRRGTDFQVHVSSNIGVSAGVGQFDLISMLLKAISSDPAPDPKGLEGAGLGKDKTEAIAAAIRSAVQRRLELALEGELGLLSSQDAAFLYEIDLNALESDGREMVRAALSSDLTALVEHESSLPPGIRWVRSIFTTTRERGQTLRINLLGIYNFVSVNELTLKGRVVTDPESGQIVITDEANASRVSANINFLADSAKLRKVLAQSFLITAAYRCSHLVGRAPEFRSSCWFFSLHATTGPRIMEDNLSVVEALGLITNVQKRDGLHDVRDFGRSTFYVSTDYDDNLTQSLFLIDGQPRALDEFEKIGRKALQFLVHRGDEDDYRLRSVTDDEVWERVKATGGTPGNLHSLFPDLRADLQIPVIAGDYVLIEWWATAMAEMAQTLARVRPLLAQTPPPDMNGDAFKKVQAELWEKMSVVGKNTHDRFAEPWGLLAMDLASGQRSHADVQITSPRLAFLLERS